MKAFTHKAQKGIGLIEVLITAIVIALGLLAVASMQAGFMASSSDSKTRSEALALAERKQEELRNNITVGGYNGLASGTYQDPNPINGVNASFTRSWIISDADAGIAGSDAPNRKKISVCVSWDSGNCVQNTTDKKVNVVTEMAYLDPAKAALYAGTIASGGSMAVPSPRQNASEDVASENVDATRPTPLPGTATISLVNGELPSEIHVTGDNNGSFVLTPITAELPATHYYSAAFGDGSGTIAVYLCTEIDSSTATCKYIQNHFGGVPLRIAGTVYSTNIPSNPNLNALDDVLVAWSSSEVHYCYNGPRLKNPASGTSVYHYMAYECVFAGNCNATADSVNYCYPDSAVSDDQINNRHVGPGGEYGELGLIGVNDLVRQEQVCFLEDTTDPNDSSNPLLDASGDRVLNDDYLFPVTKRSYVTRRIKRNSSNTGNEQVSEGINRSYTNHNFLVIKRGNYSGREYEDQCHYYATTNNLVLAPRQIVRTLNESGQPNEVLANMAYPNATGTAKHITGTINGSATNLKLYIPETGACYLDNNDSPSSAAEKYACAVPSDTPLSTSGIAIKGGSAQFPTSSPAAFASCTKTSSSTCAWTSNFTP
ncbi:MAG: type IV pilus modification PilV family protein [Gammaproteobacteria bacterium]